jgi:hypothetical protein
MNIFILDNDIEQCAKYHCDQHVNKMILESAQLLCTVLNLKGFTTPYRSTHTKHPCMLWAGDSFDNFQWLVRLSEALNKEYRWRYDKEKDHASIKVIRQIEEFRFPSIGLTPFAQAMPDQYKDPSSPVTAYRRFYCAEKASFAKWTKRPAPDWFLPNQQYENQQYDDSHHLQSATE